MALQASSGACGALDPLLLPLENKLAAKPATKVCCCCEDLRMGLMIITAVFGLSFLADGVAGLIGSSLWPVSVIELVFCAVSAYGFYGLYSRRPEGARLLARMYLLLAFCTLLLLVTMPLWVPVLCSDLESLELSSARQRCARATASIACADHNACLWNATTSACEHSPTHRVWGEDGACLIDFEVAELVTCVALIAFLIYLAWAFIGYALQFEAGEGASMCDPRPGFSCAVVCMSEEACGPPEPTLGSRQRGGTGGRVTRQSSTRARLAFRCCVRRA